MTVYKNFLNQPIKLIWIMHKLNNPLSISAYPYGAKLSKKFFDFPKHITTTYYDNGDLYFDKEEIDKVANFIKNKIENNPDYPDVIFAKMKKLGKQIEKQKIAENCLHKQNLKRLIQSFKEQRKLWLSMIAFMSYRGSVQMAETLRNKAEIIFNKRIVADKLPEIFLTPSEPSIIWKEKKSLLEVALNRKKINRHLKEYNWINYHWFLGSDTSNEIIKNRITSIKNHKKELANLNNEKKKLEQDIKGIYKKLKLNKAEITTISQLRKWIFARSCVKDNINLAAYKLLPTLYTLAEKKGINKEDIIYLTNQEIDHLDSLAIKKIKQLISSRKINFSAGVLENNFLIKKIKINQYKTTQTNKINGNTAMRGKIKGIVKIILTPKENNLVQSGDILVTSMTTPDFLPAMERAAGFVTDEGGITCHAAIIAREMKKPCIIGTKNATKLLKSGDLIELNADEGLVTILKK